MTVHKLTALFLLGLVGFIAAVDISENQISNEARSIPTGEELVSQIAGNCFGSDVEVMTCVRSNVLVFLDGSAAKGRSAEERQSVDEMIMERVSRYLNTHEFKLQLPEFLFQRAQLTFRPAKGLDNFKVAFPEEKTGERSITKARGHLKKKLLLPVIILGKIVMKALTPLFLVIIGMKATKALILSKIAIAVVLGFVIMQVLGMKKVMPMPMPELAPPSQYGPPPPAPPMPYGAPAAAPGPYGAPAAAPAPASPPSSYEPGWEPAAAAGTGGPYSRVWDSHQLAYSGYYNPQQQGPQTSTASQQASQKQ